MTNKKGIKRNEDSIGTGNRAAKKPKVGKETTARKGAADIDEIFSTKKAKLSEQPRSTTTRPRGGPKRAMISKRETRRFEAEAKGWVDDGLGGKYNAEGYTGRVEDGVKVFKAHVLNKPNSGTTKKCPFDCDCCFI